MVFERASGFVAIRGKRTLKDSNRCSGLRFEGT